MSLKIAMNGICEDFKMVIRIFTDIQDFKDNTGFKVGSAITVRCKAVGEQDYKVSEKLITGMDYSTNEIFLGTQRYSLLTLAKQFEYLDGKTWKKFGELENSNVTNAKFQVGSRYKYSDIDGNQVYATVNARYEDQGKPWVVLNNEAVSVYLDEKYNETVDLFAMPVSAKNICKFD